MLTIFTDSCADLRPDFIAAQQAFHVLSLSYTIGKEQHIDAPGQGLDTATFYRRLSDGETSVTSQVNVETFCNAFRPLLKEGKEILYIAFSSALSGTCQSAIMAQNMLKEEQLGGKLIVVDTLAASGGQGLCVYLALQKREQGMDVEAVAKWLEDSRQNIVHWFTVDDLQFLKRGGRCSPTAAFFGSLMNIKPVLHVSPEGKLIARDKVRGRNAALRGLVDRMENLAVNPKEQTIFISNAACEEDAHKLSEMIHERLGVPMDRFIISSVGPVVGSHSGPGTLALFFWGKDRG